MKSDSVFLGHILDEIDFVLKVTAGKDLDAFAEDEVLRRACTRSFEVIGEAVKKLSPRLRAAHDAVEWQKIAGMRDRLIHNYFDVDYRVLWDAVQRNLPVLRSQIEGILEDEENRSGT